jgi:uncharacterized protein with PQ loop repeat
MRKGSPTNDPERIMLTFALGWLGAALSMTLLWPQVWRSCVQRRTNGLSPTACMLGVAMPFGWITYGLLIGDRIQVVTNSVSGAAGVTILAALLITRPELRSGRALAISASGPAVIALLAASCAGAATRSGISGTTAAHALGAVLAAASALSAIPQPLALLRDPHQDTAGLSPLRWRMAAGACSLWLLYGLSTGQAAVWSSAVVGLTSAAIVCTVLFLGARRVAAPVTARGVARVRPAEMPTMILRTA